MITRRAFAIAGGLAAYLAHSGSSAAQGGFRPTTTLISSSDSRFLTLVSKYFPQLEKYNHFGPITRWSALIFNQTAEPIYALRVKWRAARSSGQAATYNQYVVRKPSVQLTARVHSAEVPVLNPGEVGFLTPYFLWSNTAFTDRISRPTFVGKNPLGRQRIKRYKKSKPGAASFIRASQNAPISVKIVDELVGPSLKSERNHSRLASLVRNRRNAERDEAVKLQGLIGSTQRLGRAAADTAATQAAWMARHSAQSKDRSERIYLAARASFSRKVKNMANSRHASKLPAALARVASLSKA